MNIETIMPALLESFRLVVKEELALSKQEPGIKMLTAEQVCEALAISKSTLRRWTLQGIIRAVVVGNGRPKYESDEVTRVLLNNKKY